MELKRKTFYLLILFLILIPLWGCVGVGEGNWTPSNLFALIVGVDSGYTSGNLSSVDLIGESFHTQNILSGFSGDTIIKTFKKYAFIVERPSWGTIPSPTKVYEAGRWERPIKEYTLGKNIYDMVFLGEDKAYAIPWGEPFIQKINPLTGEEIRRIDLSVYSYGNDNSPNSTKGLVAEGKLFIILQRFDSGSFDYAPGTVVIIDLDSDTIKRALTLNGKNPMDMEYHNRKIYIVETGNYFNPNDDIIDVIDLNKDDLKAEKLCDNPLNDMDIYSLEITEKGEAYILGGDWYTCKVFKINLHTGILGNEIYEGGYITNIKYDPYSKYLFILDRGRGNGDGKLIIYDTEEEKIIKEILEENLGYPPYSIDILAFD
ncbi:MAG: hypothetical protein N3C62_05190 [Synergistetes bacterium]|nr:hypothetical protein [Synergistota bacterium]MCX8128108.1 hypothetical protein [Synergistota bacterium]MDW8192484.1 hypothetical protein [Synergistota bacterium]